MNTVMSSIPLSVSEMVEEVGRKEGEEVKEVGRKGEEVEEGEIGRGGREEEI